MLYSTFQLTERHSTRPRKREKERERERERKFLNQNLSQLVVHKKTTRFNRRRAFQRILKRDGEEKNREESVGP